MTTKIKHVALGISGGIAAYKTPDLVRKLMQENFAVIPILTQAAQKFVTPTTLASLAGHRVRSDLWDPDAEQHMSHIELARWADVLLIAPATMHTIATMAHGLADNLLTNVFAATTAPTVIVPAMNQQMWQHAATQRNIEQLQQDGIQVWGPAEGDQACGEVGPGRMLEPEEIVYELLHFRQQQTTTDLLENVRVLVSAGPTREAIDPVRYISNASSGKQGFAIARAAQQAGAAVTLISGPVELDTPPGVQRIDVVSAHDMKQAVLARASSHDVFFSVAAVADYRPATVAERKLKKGTQQTALANLKLTLTENDDILRCLAESQPGLVKVGFAAETNDVLTHARVKRIQKCLDFMVVNDVSDPTIGFDSSDNEVTLIHAQGEKKLTKSSKELIAQQILQEIAPTIQARLA